MNVPHFGIRRSYIYDFAEVRPVQYVFVCIVANIGRSLYQVRVLERQVFLRRQDRNGPLLFSIPALL